VEEDDIIIKQSLRDYSIGFDILQVIENSSTIKNYINYTEYIIHTKRYNISNRLNLRT